MTKWITLLRLIGTLLFFGLIADLIASLQSVVIRDVRYIYPVLLPALERLSLVALCYGGAAGLVHLSKIEKQIAQAAARRRIKPQPEDNAPVAPNWSSNIEPPRQKVTPGLPPQRRIDRVSRKT